MTDESDDELGSVPPPSLSCCCTAAYFVSVFMLRSKSIQRSFRNGLLSRGYATASSSQALVFLEQQGGVIDSASLSAVTAAEKLGGTVTGLIIGAPEEVKKAVENAKK